MSYEMAFRLIRSAYFVLHADCLPAATARLHMINIISQFYSDYQNASDATVLPYRVCIRTQISVYRFRQKWWREALHRTRGNQNLVGPKIQTSDKSLKEIKETKLHKRKISNWQAKTQAQWKLLPLRLNDSGEKPGGKQNKHNAWSRSSAAYILHKNTISAPELWQQIQTCLIASSQKLNNTDFGQMSQIHLKRCSSCLNMTFFCCFFPEQNDLNRSHMDVGEVLQMNNSSRASTTKLQLGPAPHLLCPVGKSIEGLPWN